MTQPFSLPYRQIHLDFHTGPQIPDVGAEFDAAEFARTMREAHVNSVTVFAKCHHGHLYYNTDRPERHPGLKPGLDLLREQVDALHREGIRAPIYISVQCDEYAANTHPEWVARKPDSGQVKGDGVFNPGWQILDLSTPYQEFLAEQTAEVLKLFKPVDGIFFDMCWDQPSTTKEAIEGMIKQNLDPESEADRGSYARNVALAYMKRFHTQVKESSPEASVFFNGRPFFNLAEDIQFQEQVEIEALPTGGWGYMYFPKNVRYARTFPKPYMGMTARFHKSWADFGGLKPYAALEYEVMQMIAHGARCSIGDQLHPRGTLDRGAYALIGEVYGRVDAREEWLEGASPVSQTGLFQLPTGLLGTTQSTSGTDEGATRMLTQLKHQFDVVSEDSDLERYELLILPDRIHPDAALKSRLAAYLQKGGALLATGTAGLSPDGTELLLPDLHLRPEGMSPFTTTYIRFGPEINSSVPDSDHVMYERGVRVTAAEGAQALAGVVEPYFERAWNHFCSHNQTPGDKLSPYAAAVQHGKTAYICYPIFSAFATHGNYPYRLLVKKVVDRLLPEPLLRVGAPTGTEATVMRQGERTIVHLLHYSPERRANNLDLVEDIVPLHNVPLSLNLDHEPKSVYMAPDRRAVPFTYANGRAEVQVPEVRGHAMVVFE
ncbi:MAG: alpha-L-fucosidase [Armatimonadota bacterium]|nr:alpha-L-fucosidase [Armatimonadota bacterium]